MAKVKESPIIEDQNDVLEEQRFQEQCFLIENLEMFANIEDPALIKGFGTELKKYTNFVQLEGSPGAIINRLLAPGVSELVNIKPFQLSLLHPKLKLYKVVAGKDPIRLNFEDFVDEKRLQQVLKGRRHQGLGVGLKKFEWEDTGTNPGDAGKVFSATLMLHFQSIEDIFQETDGVSFADLIRVTPTNKLVDGQYNEKSFRIMAEVGWEVPPQNAKFIDQRMRDAIEASCITMFLNLTTHEIDFREDGTVDLTIEYIGGIEQKMLAPETDVLYVGRQDRIGVQQLLGNSGDENASRRTAYGYEQELKAIQQQLNEADLQLQSARSEDAQSDRGAVSKFLFDSEKVNAIEDKIESLKEDQERLLKQQEQLLRQNKAKAYRNFLDLLEKEQRIFFYDITKQELELIGINKQDQQLSRSLTVKERVARRKQIRETSLPSRSNVGIAQRRTSHTATFDTLRKGADAAAEAKDDDELKEIVNATNNSATRDNKPKNPDVYRINYLFFGDIINAALQAIYLRANQATEGGRAEQKDSTDLFRFLCGPIEFTDPTTGFIRSINLSDIPISLNLFTSWFLKKVIRPQLDKYLLRDFLRDACSELIVRAISSSCFGELTEGTRNRVSFSVFSLPTGDKQDPMCNRVSSSDRYGFCRTEINNVDLLGVRTNCAQVQNLRHYFLIYVTGRSPQSLNGNFDEDIANGIYHFYFGADRGLVKRFKFSRADVQYLKEARIYDATKQKGEGDVFLSEPYNAALTMHGNAIFKPGMFLYIDPHSVGMGKTTPKNKRIPIGGYYSVIKTSHSIEPGSFETNIETSFETSGDEPFRPQVEKKPEVRETQRSIDGTPSDLPEEKQDQGLLNKGLSVIGLGS